MVDWRFRRRQGWCSACESHFATGDRHASVLSLTGDDLAREDVCVPCWDRRERGADVFYWFTHHATDRRAVHLDLSMLEELFVRLEGRSERKLCELRYLLCLLLMRKRRIRLDRVVRSGDAGESMVVHRPRRRESFHVRVFDFDVPRLAELRSELREIFDGADLGPLPETAAGSADELTGSVAIPPA